MSTNQFHLLKTKRFLPLFLTQFFGAFNDNLYKNALVILITYTLAGQLHFNIEILITIAAGIFILPFFLFSATAGQLADKFEKSQLIRYTKLAEIMLMLLAATGFYFHSVPVLMFVLFLLGTQATFFGPMKYSILPDQLQSSELIGGNGLIEFGTFISILLGTITGGILAGLSNGMLIVSISAIIVALMGFLSSLGIPKTKINSPDLKINYNFIYESWNIVTNTFKSENLYLTIIGISWFWLIGATYLSQFPTYAKDVLGAESTVVTLFLAFFTTGIGIGSLLCNRLLKGKIHATYVPLAALGMTIFAIDLVLASKHHHLAATHTLITIKEFLSYGSNWRILMDLFLLAICGGIYIVPLYAILQHDSDETHRSRVIACNNILNALFMVFASIATSFMLYLHFTVTQVFITVALANLIATIYICKLLPEAFIKSILVWFIKTLYRAEVKGIENYHKAGNRVLIIANHTSFLDGLLLTALLPDRLSFAIDSNVAKKGWLKIFLKLINTYSLDPTNPLATKSLIEYLRKDHHVVIFPEGRITVTGSLMKIYEGPGLIADKANATLLPIRINGAQYTPFSKLRGKVKLRWFPKITLTISEPQVFNIPKEITGRERRRLISSQLYDIMSSTMYLTSDIQQTLFQSILNAKSIQGGKHLVAEDIERVPINYNRLILSSIILGRAIARQTRAHHAVGILLPNSIGNVIIFFAMQFSHRVPAMLNFSAGIKNILSACEVAKIKEVYTSRKFIELANLHAVEKALFEHKITVIYLEDVRSHITIFDKFIGKLISFMPNFYYSYFNKIKKSNLAKLIKSPAVILFTSGSEGHPKGVVLSHENLQANRFQLTSRVDFNPTDRIFNALPMFHSFGLNSGTLLPIISGMYVFLYPSPLHYKIIPEICYDVNATMLFGTDTFLSNYGKYAHPYNFYSVRYIFAGAEKLREETRRVWIEKFGIRILEGYGTTETSPVLSTNTAMQYKKGSVGRLLPGIQYRLDPVSGIQDGYRLVVKGPNIMLGYLLSQAPGVLVPPEDQWYDTGDIVSIDEEGYLHIKGRAKRFAKIAGEMVSLTAVEEIIYALWPKYKHAIIAQPNERKGEELILLTDHPAADLTVIIQYFKTHGIADLTLPKKIIILEEMPVLGSGKVDYPALSAK